MPLERLVPAFVLLGLILCPQVSTLTLTYTNTPSMTLQAGSDWWHGTITIREDGSVDPADAPVVIQGNVYRLTKNVKSDGNGIIILRNNIVVDGAGHTIEGSNTTFSKGVRLFTRTNITLKNLNIRNFHFGIVLDRSSNNTIINNNIENNWVGIFLGYSSYNTIANNTITENNDLGIELYYSSYNMVTNNNVGNNLIGIYIWWSSSYNTIANNTFTGSMEDGISLNDSPYNTITDNMVKGNNRHGIRIFMSSHTTIANNTIIGNNGDGIRIEYSLNNTITGNTITGNNGVGIYIHSLYSLIYNNVFVNDVNVVIEGGVNYWSVEKIRGTNIVGGSYIGGNYWSMFSETCSDSDGDLICDQPYIIDKNNIDYYPLTKPEQVGRPPSVPIGLWGYYNGSIVLVWYPSGDIVSGYRVYRRSSTGDFALIGKVLAGKSDYYVFVDNSIERGRGYNYRVVAFNEYGESDPASINVVTSKYIGLDIKDYKISPGRGYEFTLKILSESLIQKQGIIIGTTAANGSMTPSKIENLKTLYYTLKYYPPVRIGPDKDIIIIQIYEKEKDKGKIIDSMVFFLYVSNDVATILEYGTSWDHWRDTYAFPNTEVPWSPEGVCHGMAETELLYFMHYVLGYNDYPSFPSNPSNAMKTRDLHGGDFHIGELNNVTLAIILHQLHGLQFWEHLWERISLVIERVDSKQEFSKLASYLSEGKPVILGLGPKDMHAVVAWRVDKGSDDKYYIYISDPNYPHHINYAIYDPDAKKFYYSARYYWDKFIVMEAKPLSFYDVTWPSISISKRIPMKNYYFIISSRNISIKDLLNQSRVSYFLQMGDSSSFRSNISGVAGVSERDFIAFAVLWNKRVIIDPEGYSSILVFWANSTELGVEVYGYWFNVTSDTGFAIVPLRDGFNITVSDNTVVLNITAFSYINDFVNVFNAYNIVLNPFTEALFTITDWSALNTTEKPVINLKAYNATNKQYIGETQIYNGQTGVEIVLGSGPPPVEENLPPPRDLDGDGLYEDINGNGRLDFDDVVRFFRHFDDPVISQYSRYYDFNRNGRLDYDDIVELFKRV